MPICKEYLLAHSLPEALHFLAGAKQPARLVAGGTDLLIDIQQGRCPPVHTLVDITEIDELRKLEVRSDEVFIGAAVPLAQLAASPLVGSHAAALRQACELVGGPQVRNTATLGGNVAHALPAADGSIALMALNAYAEIAGYSVRYRLPLPDLFLAPGKSALTDRNEILVGFYIQQAQPGEASAFQRVMRPQGVALPILNMAVWIQRKHGVIADVRIALGPSGQVPYLASAVEQVLRGQRFSSNQVDLALEVLAQSVKFRTSPQRATSAYRQHLATVLLSRLLHQVWEEAVLNPIYR